MNNTRNTQTNNKKPTLQEQLAKRKFKLPNRVVYFLYFFIMTYLVSPKYKPHYVIEDDINDCDGPCFLIWNHLSRLDHLYCMRAAWPRRLNILAGYNEFFRSHLHLVFKLNQILPKKNYTQDIAGMKAMNSILKKGGCVCFAPEGMSSIYGTNQPIIPGTGHLFKHYRLPVYFLEMRGQYLTNTKCNLDERSGYTRATMKLLFTPEQLDELSGEEIDARIDEVFRHDEYAWNKQVRVPYKSRGRQCEHLEEICFRCPRCGADLTMKGEGMKIRCTACGNGAATNDCYDFLPFDDSCRIPESPSKWVEWERAQIIREIRADAAYSYTEHVTLGEIPTDHLIPGKKSAELCGEGLFTVDHEGLHFRGTRHGAPVAYDFDYKTVFSLIIVTDTTNFSLYYKGEYLEFTPETPSVGKLLLLTEEMHRLHENSWKNFPWNAWMYEEN